MRCIPVWLPVLMLLLPACSDDSNSPDTTAPAAVYDLAVRDSSGGSVTLVWTAPGDDGENGRAARYDIRRATDFLSAGVWDAATAVEPTRVPKPGGQAETLIVGGLSRGPWWFALKAADEVPNWSELSNVAGATLRDTIPSGRVGDLAMDFATTTGIMLTWTAPAVGDSGHTASQYDLRYARSSITEETWAEASRVQGLSAPSVPGSAESFLVTGLLMGATYSFAVKVIDDSLHASMLSNVASGATASLVQLTFNTDPRGAYGPQWSPEGANIAFVADRRIGGFYYEIDVSMVSVQGGEPARLTDDPDRAFSPSWSPDGTHLAFLSGRTQCNEIYVMEATAGADPARVTSLLCVTFPTQACWSPDGSRFAYVHETYADPATALYVTPAAGGASTLVCQAERIQGIAWSPDGSRLALAAYQGTYPGGDWELWVVPAQGGVPARLTHDPGDDLSPAWSPDGRWILFESDRTGVRDLWLTSVDGERSIRVTADHAADSDPCWSPDGCRIAFARERNGIRDIWVLDLHGSPGLGR